MEIPTDSEVQSLIGDDFEISNNESKTNVIDDGISDDNVQSLIGDDFEIVGENNIVNPVQPDIFADAEQKNKFLGEFGKTLPREKQLDFAQKFAPGQLQQSLQSYWDVPSDEAFQIDQIAKEGKYNFPQILTQEGKIQKKKKIKTIIDEIMSKNDEGRFNNPLTAQYMNSPVNSAKNRDNYRNLLEAEQIIARNYDPVSFNRLFHDLSDASGSLIRGSLGTLQSYKDLFTDPAITSIQPIQDTADSSQGGQALSNLTSDINKISQPNVGVVKANQSQLDDYIEQKKTAAEIRGIEYNATREQEEKEFISENKLAQEYESNFMEALKPIPDEYTSGFNKFATDVIGITPQILASMGLSTIDPLAGASFMWQLIYGGTYLEHTEQGIDPTNASRAALFNASVQAPLEYIGLTKVMKMFKTTGTADVLKNWGSAMITEFGTEFLQSYVEEISNIPLDKEAKTGKEQLLNFIDRLPETTKQGIREGLIVSVFSLFGGAVKLPTQIKVGQQKALDKKNYKVYDELNTKLSELEKGSKEKTADFIQEVSEKKGIPTRQFYKFSEMVDAFGSEKEAIKALEKLGALELYKNKEVADGDISLDIPSQLKQEEQDGGTIEISAPKWGELYAGTDESVALRNNLRFESDGLTSQESAQAETDLKRQAQDDTTAQEATSNLIEFFKKTDVGRVIYNTTNHQTIAEAVADVKQPIWTPEYANDIKSKAGYAAWDNSQLNIKGFNVETESESSADVITLSESADITTVVEERTELALKKRYKINETGEFIDPGMNQATKDTRERMRIQHDYTTTQSDIEFASTLAIDYFNSENPETFWGVNSFTKEFKKVLDQLRDYFNQLIENVGIYTKARESGAINDDMHNALKEAITGNFEALQKTSDFTDAVQILDEVKSSDTLDLADDTTFQIAPENKLVAFHNLTLENLKHADKIGGIVAPSVGITTIKNPLSNFGEIVLIPKPDLIDPRNRNTITKNADFFNTLQDAPTEYFESKIVDNVSISDFDYALVPKGARYKEALAILKNKNVKVKRYDLNKKGSLQEAYSNLNSNITFQIQPTEKNVWDAVNNYNKLTKIHSTFRSFNSREKQAESQAQIDQTLNIISRMTGIEAPSDTTNKAETDAYIREVKTFLNEAKRGREELPTVDITTDDLTTAIDNLKSDYKNISQEVLRESSQRGVKSRQKTKEERTPVIQKIKELGGIKKPKGSTAAEYDGLPPRNEIKGFATDVYAPVGKSGMQPDELAQILYDENLIDEATPDAMYQVIRDESSGYVAFWDNKRLSPQEKVEEKALLEENTDADFNFGLNTKRTTSLKKEISPAVDRALTNVARIQAHIETLIKSMDPVVQGRAKSWITKVANVYKKDGNINTYINNSIKAFERITEKHEANMLVVDIFKLTKQLRARKDFTGRVLSRRMTDEEQATIGKAQEYIKLTIKARDAKIEDISDKLQKGLTEKDILTETELKNDLNLLMTFGHIINKKPSEVRHAFNELSNIIEKGLEKRNLFNQQRKSDLTERINTTMDVVSGGKAILGKQATSKNREKRAKYFFNKFQQIKDFGARNLSWEYIMNALTRGSSEIAHLEGPLQEYTNLVHIATHKRNNRLVERTRHMNKNLSEIYNVSTARQLASKIAQAAEPISDKIHLTDIKHTPANINIEEAREILSNRSIKTGELFYKNKKVSPGYDEIITNKALSAEYFSEKQGREDVIAPFDIEIIESVGDKFGETMNQFEAIQYALMLEQTDFLDNFFYNGWDDSSINELYEFLTPESIKIKQYMQSEYKKQYAEMNAVYKKIFFIDMPKIELYSRAIFDVDKKNAETDFSDIQGGGGVGLNERPTSLIGRVNHLKDPKKISALQVFEREIISTEHFKAFGELAGLLRGVFKNEKVRRVITQEHGAARTKIINDFVDDIIRGGIDPSKISPIFDKIRSTITLVTLSGKVASFGKQLTSYPAFLTGMPTVDFMKYTKEFFENPTENWKEIYKGDYVQSRLYLGNISQTIQNATRASIGKPKNYAEDLLRTGMAPTKYGDITPIIVGLYAKSRSYYERNKTDNMTETEDAVLKEKAMLEAEKLSDRLQQSSDTKDLGSFQRLGSAGKMFLLYHTSPIAYNRATMEAIADAFAGKPKAKKQAVKNIATVVSMGILFQMVTDSYKFALSGGEDLPEWEDYVLAGVLAPVRGMLFAGNAITYFSRKLMSLYPGQFTLSQASSTIGKSVDLMFDAGSLEWEKALNDLGRIFGAYQTIKPAISKKKKKEFKF